MFGMPETGLAIIPGYVLMPDLMLVCQTLVLRLSICLVGESDFCRITIPSNKGSREIQHW